MKKFNRVLAMILAIIMTLAVMPLSVFANAWLDTNVESDKNGNATTTDVTLTLDTATLLNYLKNGDKAALLAGISLGNLADAFTREELSDIFPGAKLEEIVSDLAEDIDVNLVLQYLDIEVLLDKIDTDGLIEQIKALPNLEDYVLDFDALMGYIEDEDLEAAIEYIDTDALVEDHTDGLIPLALDLDAETLMSIVDVDAVMDLEGIDLAGTINMDFVENEIGLDTMFDTYIDQSKFADYLHSKFTDVDDKLHDYIILEKLDLLLADHEEDLEPYMNFDNIQGLVADKTYATLKNYLKVDKLYDVVTTTPYAELESYIDQDLVTEILSNPKPDKPGEYWIDPVVLALYMDASGKVDVETLRTSPYMTDEIYDVLIERDAIDMTGMLTSDNAPLDMETLHDAEVVDIKKMVTGNDRLFTIQDLEDNEVIDLDKVLMGDNTVIPPLAPLDPEMLVKEYGVFDLEKMLKKEGNREPLFTIPELLGVEGIVKVDDLVAEYSYNNLVLDENLKAQINALPDKSVLSDCIEDTVGAIKAIGVSAAVTATCGSYSALIENYVLADDKAAMMEALGIDTLVSEIAEDDKLNVIFDVEAIVNALGISNLLELIDLQFVISKLIENGGLTEILKSIEIEKYQSAVTSVLSVLEKNINEIKVNDIAITEKDGDMLSFKTANLFTLMEDFFPELEDLANMGDDGKVFSASIVIKYKSENTNNVEKTKAINVGVVLDGGAALVRTAAQKLKAVLDKFVTYDFKDGIFALDLRIPSQFATAVKIALQKLETTGDSDLQDLKDVLLSIFDTNVSDTGALIDGFTLDQVVSLLELVDSSKFSVAYNKIITSNYVEFLLNYIKEATGQDFTNLTPSDLLIKATELPTLDSICDKIEAKLGKEIAAFDMLPAADPVAIIQKVIDKTGLDVDIKEILKNAAEKPDPMKSAYDTVVEIIDNSDSIYNAIKSRLISVIETGLASNIGTKLGSLSMSDFYEASGVFRFAKSIQIQPTKLLKKVADKAASVVASKLGLDAPMADWMAKLFVGYFTDDTVELGVNLSTRFVGMYKAVFHDENGKEIFTTLLSAGADLKLMQDYEPLNPTDTFMGWKALTSDTTYDKMPAQDIGLIADVGKLLVTVIDPDDATKLIGIIPIDADTALVDYTDVLNALVKDYLGDNSLTDKEIVWLNYEDRAEIDMDAVIETNLYLTWRLEKWHTVTIVDPDTNETVYEFEVKDGETLEGYLADMLAQVKDHLADDTIADEDIIWMYNDAEYDVTAPVTGDMVMTWKINVPEAPTYTVTIVHPDLSTIVVDSFLVVENETLRDYLAQMNDIVRGYLDDDTIADEDILWFYMDGEACDLDAAITADVTVTWDIDEPDDPIVETVTVTLVDRLTNAPIWDYSVIKGGTLSTEQILDMIEKVQLAEGDDTLTADDINWLTVAGGAFDVTAAIVEDVQVTWSIKEEPDEDETYTIIVVDPETKEPLWTKTDIEEGTLFNEFKEDIEALVTGNPSNLVHKYHHVWKDIAIDGWTLDWNAEITGDYTLTWFFVEDPTKTTIRVNVSAGYPYSIYFDATANCWVVEFENEWPETLELDIDVAFYEGTTHGLLVRSKNADVVNQFKFSDVILNKVAAFAKDSANFTETITTVSIHYENGKGKEEFGYADVSGAVYFTMGFYFNGYENGVEKSIGNFGSNDVMVTLPFAGAASDANKQTFVTLIGKDANGNKMDAEDIELENFDASGVTFYMPHFSYGAIVTKYYVYNATTPDMSQLPADFPDSLKPVGNIATFPIEPGFYAAGHVFGSVDSPLKDLVTLLGSVNGFEVLSTNIYRGATAGATAELLGTIDQTYTMPAHEIILQHVIDIKVYFIYYYASGELFAVDHYTILETMPALKTELPQGYEAADEWYWSGYDASAFAVEDLYVYLVKDKVDSDKDITVNFLNKNNEKIAEPITKALREWTDLSKFPTVAAVLNLTDVDATKAAYWIVKIDSTDKRMNDLTTEEWNAILAANTSINVYVEYVDREYTVYTDGNVTLEKINAAVGETVQITLRTENGMTVTVTVKNLADPTSKITFTFADGSDASGSFVMPAADVKVEVTYTAKQYTYVDADGKEQTGSHGDTNELPAIVIPEGMTLDATKFTNIPNGLVLASSSMDANRNLILVYRYVLVDDSVNEQAFIAAVKASAIKALVYDSVYVLNGQTFETEDAALATVTGSATFKDWSKTFGKNLNFAAFNLASENLEPSLLILCIVLIVLILILLIVLFYILYITGKLKPNWFLKAITVIVSGFYAACMGVAAAGLAIAKFFGYREEELLETPEEINERLASESEESADEVAEEATEEVAEEATEEAAEEVTEEAAEEATEEVAEEATEEVAEEATEEVAEEATEKVAEEATEEAAEEVTEEAAEEATEEAAEEATEEAAEEVTEEAAEEVTEEAAEEATEEVAEEVTEEVAEEATEEVAEEKADKKDE